MFFHFPDNSFYTVGLYRYVSEFEPADWWKIQKRKAERQFKIAAARFCEFMIGLHSCPASSAGIERWFSTVGFVWSKTRNRLGMQKAQKLAACYRALRPQRHRQKGGPVQEQEQSQDVLDLLSSAQEGSSVLNIESDSD